MTRSDLAWTYYEFSKYVQFPEKNYIHAAGHVLSYLRGTWNQTIRYFRDSHLGDKKIPWRRRRRLGMAVAGNTPTASFLTKIGKMRSAGCRLCKIVQEARGESTDGLADETHGHINSAGCEEMATTVTAAHHSIWRHLYARCTKAKEQARVCHA